MSKFEIKNRFSGEVIFSCEIDDSHDNKSHSIRLGAAVKIAVSRKKSLRGAYLQEADLRGAYLRGAYLQEADLRGAYLQEADLREADLRGAYLQEADLRGAYLWEADLRGADLQGADLRGAYLQGADLWGEKLYATPKQIVGYKYRIFIAGTKMRVGCELHSIDEWDSFGRAAISMMDAGAWDWWKEHKPLIMPIAKHHMQKHIEAEKANAE